MDIEVTAHVLRLKHSNEIASFVSIPDMYAQVCVKYEASEVREEQLIDWLKAVWGSNWAKLGASLLEEYSEKGYFCIRGEAKDIPCIGNYLSRVETKIIQDW